MQFNPSLASKLDLIEKYDGKDPDKLMANFSSMKLVNNVGAQVGMQI
jgi:hypothetical protein